MGRLSGQVVLITGGGRGIGLATARAFAKEEAIVGIAEIDAVTAAAAAAEIELGGGSARAFAVDVGQREAVLDAAAKLAAEFGRLDTVVNNAMWIRYEPVSEVREESFDRMLAVGLKSLMWGAQAALLHMDATRGGAIVNLASPVADIGVKNAAVYSAVKGAVGALTRQFAVEFGSRKIRVNAVAPGAIPTPGARSVVDESGYEARRLRTPLARLGEAGEIAAAIVFLASPDALFITGEILHVDGGISIAGT